MRFIFLREPSGLVLLISLFCCCMLHAQYVNVRVSNPSSTTPEEVTIAINPTNPLNLIAGANLRFYYYSSNGGLTWVQGQLPSGTWGDPCVIFDASGKGYYAHLSNPSGGYFIERLIVHRSTNGGMTWSDSVGVGYNPPKQQDKEWLAADMTNSFYRGNVYMAWTEFDSYGSANPQDSSRILFSRSTNAGQTWSTPLRVSETGGNCIDEDTTTEGAVPAVGPNGEVYTSWSGPLGIMFDRSTDGGVTFGTDNFVTTQPGGWDFGVPGIYRCNGMPITACDVSNSPYRGHVYVTWSDQRNGLNNTDVFLIKSTDRGQTWGPIKRVNDDITATHQFFPWMTIDQFTGILYFVFYDRRNTSGNATDVFVARSADGGETFTNFKVSQSSFTPMASIFFGDYTNIAANNGKVYPMWMRMDGTALSVWVALVTDSLAQLPAQVTLVSPANSATTATDSVVFVWNRSQPAVSAYWFEHSADSVFANSVVDSSIVDTTTVVHQLVHNQTYWWRVRAKNTSGWGAFSVVRRFVASFSLAVSVESGWNLISSPVTRAVNMDSVKQLYPGSLFPYAFEFSPGIGYVQSFTMMNGKGYWGKFASPGTNTVSGAPIYVDSVSVSEGWNLIGSVSTVVDTGAIVSIPSGIRTSDWFGYEGGYAPTALIVPGKAYWVKAGTPGLFVLSSGPVENRQVPSEQGMEAFSRFTITEVGCGNQTLYVVADAPGGFAANKAELPPPGPDGVFDARFESQRLCEVYDEKAKRRFEFPVIIRSARFPVTVSWEIKSGGRTTFFLRDGTGGARFAPRHMSGTGKYTISDPAIKRLIVSVEPSAVPEDFVLLQNFPNPFNPSTTIQFGLPYDAVISLDLYDALGQHIATIEQGKRGAGYHDVVVQNSGLASGVYFYRLKAEGLVISRKLVILK